MDTTNLTGKTAMVTGAGSGIGRATALLMAQRGADLFLCDIDERSLAETAELARALGRKVLAQRVDVADRGQMRAFADTVHAQVAAVDIVMNNAGVGLGGGFLDTDLEDWDWIIGINLFGVLHGCHFFVPPMVKRGRGGHVINVSSTAGYIASEVLSAYCTTKFAVLGHSEALRSELARYHIGVTAVCPGLINTAITRTARLRGAAAAPAAREQMIAFYEKRNYTPERVAENILKAVHRNRAVAPISPEAWALYMLKRLSPGLVAWVNRRMAESARRQAKLPLQ